MKKIALLAACFGLCLLGCSDDSQGSSGKKVDPNACTPACTDGQFCDNGECKDEHTTSECGEHQKNVDGDCVDRDACPPACHDGEICINGFCHESDGSTCDPTCQDGQICLESRCQSPTVCIPECASGEKCVNGSCTKDDPCSKCNPDTQVCENNTCVPKTADNVCDPTCDAGYICKQGECVDDPNYEPPCVPACHSGEVCIDQKCMTPSNHCDPACEGNQICIDEECVDGATCSPACSDEQVCINGACVDKTDESSCALTASCAPGACLNGACTLDTACNPACEENQVCINGVCRSGDGSECDPACSDREICVQKTCVRGNSCTPACAENEVCINGTCLTDGDKACDPPCSMTQICVNGVCTDTNECVPGCRSGYACINGKCLSSEDVCPVSCQTGYACFGVDEAGTGLCVPQTTCSPACKLNEVCVNGVCLSGQTNDCEEPCPDEQVCIKGQCVPGKKCDPDCFADQICVNGTCVNSDNCNPKCAPGKVCVNNICVGGHTDRCTPDCDGNQTCINGLCIYVDDESCDPKCPEDKICINGKCTISDDGTCNPSCPEDKVCVDGKCHEKDDATCDPACEVGKICREGQCVEGDDGSCKPACKEGYFCQKGVCLESCQTTSGIRCESLCCEGKTPICDEIEKVCLADCSESQTRCGDDLCCDNETEFCIYGVCKSKATHNPCESAKDCPLDAYCEASVGMCISEDDVPSDCKRSTETYPFDAELFWNWPKNISNSPTPGKSRWLDNVDSYNVMATPIVINLTDDNGDGKINENDIPEVVFPTFRTSAAYSGTCCYCGVSSIRAVTTSPDGKLIELAASDELYHGEEDLGAADIDGDGVPEVIAGSPQELHALRLVKDETSPTGYKWDTVYKLAVQSTSSHSSLRLAASFADLEGDGVVDIITNYGVSIVVDGKLQWKKTADGKDCRISSSSHTAADLDNDGKMEILAGNTIYDYQCTKLINTSVLSGYVSVANLLKDSDNAAETGELVPEIATVSGSAFHFFKVYKKDDVWSVKETWKNALPVNKNHSSYKNDCKTGSEGHCQAAGGPPVIGDFNGDTIPDVGVATRYYYIVYSNDGKPTGGKILWADGGTQDVSSAVTGSSLFDFQGDGVAEILYADELNLYVYNGQGTSTDANGDGYNDPSFIIGRTLEAAQKFIHSSGTAYEYPIVVDMDNDGKSEIVHASNHYSGLVNPLSKTKGTGVSVYKDTQNRWVRTRRIWNQHDYHVTNINEDGTVPRHETPNWTMKNLNNFRQNVQPSAINAAPNITPKVLSYGIGKCDDAVTLVARFSNIGGLGTSDKFNITFYARDAANTDHVIGQFEHAVNTIPGTPINITFDWNFTSLDGTVTFDPYKQTQVYYTIDTPDADHPEGFIYECREDDNVSYMLAVGCPPPEISIN